MEFVRITDTESYNMVGMNFFGDPFGRASAWNDENEIGELWKRFMKFYHGNPDAIKNIKTRDWLFEVHFITEQTVETGLFDIFAGVAVESLEKIPIECVARQLPPTKYAVFTLKGKEIISDWWSKILTEELFDSDYEISYNYSIQCYTDRYKGIERVDESELDVFVPVKLK